MNECVQTSTVLTTQVKPSPGFRLRIRTLLTSLQVKEISKRETLFPAALNQTHPRVGRLMRSIKARKLRVRGRPLSRGGMSPDVHNFDPVSAASLQRWYDLSHARRHRKFVGISTHRPLWTVRVFHPFNVQWDFECTVSRILNQVTFLVRTAMRLHKVEMRGIGYCSNINSCILSKAL